MKKITMLLAVMLLSANTFAEEQVVLRFSHVVKKGAPKDLVIEKFKSLVEKYSEGRVKVENYADSALFGDRDEMKAVIEGRVDMIAPSLSKTDQLYKEKSSNPYLVLDVPFLFESPDLVKKLAGNPVLDEMAATVDKKEVKIVGVWDNGLKQLSINNKVESLADLKEKRIRVQPSAVLKATIKSWGSVPRELSYAEVYNGLLYQTLDGAENPISNLYSSRFHDVQKYLYMTNHGYLGYAWIANKKSWDGLSPENKAAVEKAAVETNKLQSDIAATANEYAKQDVNGSGMTRVLEPSAELIKEMKSKVPAAEAVLSPVQKEFYAKLKATLK